jgi:hypothetical protein
MIPAMHFFTLSPRAFLTFSKRCLSIGKWTGPRPRECSGGEAIKWSYKDASNRIKTALELNETVH